MEVDLESKGLKVKHGKTKVLVSGSITQHGSSKTNIDLHVVCSLRVNANTALCAHVVSGSMVDMWE